MIVGIAIAYDTFFADQIMNGTVNATSSDLNFFSQFIVDFSKEMPFFYGLFTIILTNIVTNKEVPGTNFVGILII